MIIAALLSWYDEAPDDLVRAIRSAAAAGVSRLVAVDGAYALYPDAAPRSPEPQVRAIQAAARSCELDLALRQPVNPWPDEMAKRTALFALADAVTDDGDWLLVLDADYEIRSSEPLPALLAGRDELVGEARLHVPPSPLQARSNLPIDSRIRTLFRGRGIRVVGNHYTYELPDGRRLWAHPTDPVEPAIDLKSDVIVVHHTFARAESRVAAQSAYYDERDASGVERTACRRCGQRTAVAWMPTGLADATAETYSCDWTEVCRECIPDVVRENLEHARRLGIDPDRVTRPQGVVRGAF